MLSSKLLRKGRAVVIALDHGLEHGPGDFGPKTIDPVRVADEISGFGDGFMVQKGIAKLVKPVLKCKLVVKLTGRSGLAVDNTQVQVATVKDAKALGASAVAATVYPGEVEESRMLAQLGMIQSEARKAKLPLIGFMYPRGPGLKKDSHDPEIVAYAARIGAELGCDLIKTYYTGSRESFARVVEACPVPVLAAGGKKRGSTREALQDFRDVLDAGGAGLVCGRNLWQHSDMVGMAKAVYSLVHEDASVEEAAALVSP